MGLALKDQYDRITHFFEVSAKDSIQARIADTAATPPALVIHSHSLAPKVNELFEAATTAVVMNLRGWAFGRISDIAATDRRSVVRIGGGKKSRCCSGSSGLRKRPKSSRQNGADTSALSPALSGQVIHRQCDTGARMTLQDRMEGLQQRNRLLQQQLLRQQENAARELAVQAAEQQVLDMEAQLERERNMADMKVSQYHTIPHHDVSSQLMFHHSGNWQYPKLKQRRCAGRLSWFIQRRQLGQYGCG